MTEAYLERLTRARQKHTLAALRPVLIAEAPAGTPDPGVRSGRGATAPVVLELTG
jgi:hypothetical protein